MYSRRREERAQFSGYYYSAGVFEHTGWMGISILISCRSNDTDFKMHGNSLVCMPTYSHSRLSTFEKCPLKYKYTYIEKIPLEARQETVEAFMGKRVHETLCKLYADRIMAKADALDELLAYYDDIWRKSWSDEVLIARAGQVAQDYNDIGKKCVADYYRRYSPFEDGRTLGLEQMINIDIDGYRLIGYIDRLSQREDGRYEIHDYKTAGKLPQQQFFDDDRQLALYQIGVERTRKDAHEVDLVWHYLVHDREVRSRRGLACIIKLKQDVVATIKEIERSEKEDRFPAVKNVLCKWCDYQALCLACAEDKAHRK